MSIDTYDYKKGRCCIQEGDILSIGEFKVLFTTENDKQVAKDMSDNNITAFGKTAESCANYLSKGNKCAVQGRISTGSYTTQAGNSIVVDVLEAIFKQML